MPNVPALSLPWRTTSVDAGEPCKGSGVSYWLDHWLFRWFRLDPTQEASKADAKGLKEDLARVGRLARHEWHTLCLGIGFLLTAAGFRTLIPQAVASTLIVALKPEADAHAQHQALVRSAKRLALLALGYGVFSGLRGLLMSIAENRLLLQLRRQTFSRLLQQDIAFHDVRDVGELTSRLNSDCEAVASGLSLNLNIFLRSGVQLVFGVCYLAVTSWQLSLILLGVWVVLFYVYGVYGRFARRSSLIRQDKLAALNSVATEALQNVRTLRALEGEQSMVSRYSHESWNLIFLEHQRAAAYGVFAVFYNGLTEGIKAVALGAGGVLVARGGLSPEQLTASMLYVDNVVGSSLSVGGQYRQLMQAIGSSRKVFEYAEMPPSPSVEPSNETALQIVPSGDFRGSVLFRNVSFTYASRTEPVLQGFDLELTPGSTIALVGHSGCGKSTVAALLQRWYEPDHGRIFLDGRPIDELDPRWFRSLFGVVTQDPRLFSATVWENIALGLGNAFDSHELQELMVEGLGVPRMDVDTVTQLVRQAAQAADAESFISQLPQGYDTFVGDVRLSGGQRQRIALARALVRRPRILILDEATSALDSSTEAEVQVSVNAYLKQRSASCLVIAHRLSTVQDADQIVVLDKGRIAEMGKHQALLRRRGLYSQLAAWRKTFGLGPAAGEVRLRCGGLHADNSGGRPAASGLALRCSQMMPRCPGANFCPHCTFRANGAGKNRQFISFHFLKGSDSGVLLDFRHMKPATDVGRASPYPALARADRIASARSGPRSIAMTLKGKPIEELLQMQSEAVKQVLMINQAIAELQRAQPELREVRDRRVSTASVRSMTTKEGDGNLKEPLLFKRQHSPGVSEGFGIFAQGAMFPDADKIKDKVRASLFSPEFNPEDIYKTTGWCQQVARNQFFKNLTMFVIVLNAIWIGVDTDLNPAELEVNSPLIFQVVDNIFCIFFCFEITVRYFAYQQPCDAFKDFSFAFDFSLVLTMIWEVWVCSIIVVFMRTSGGTNLSVLRLLRLFRLVRIARVGRLMSSCRELVVLVKGIGMGLRSVLSTLFLMMVVIYVFAIIFTQLFRDTEEAEGCYENVLQSMNCLMLNVVFPEQQELMQRMLQVGPTTYLLGIFYLLVTGLTASWRRVLLCGHGLCKIQIG
ncbi:unnamed protein product [Effrenium voratum]|nr:unnamed protein product [Effrenium voratum]